MATVPKRPGGRLTLSAATKRAARDDFRVYSSHIKAGSLSLLHPCEKAPIAEDNDVNHELTSFGEIAACFAMESRADHEHCVMELDVEEQEVEVQVDAQS